MSTDKFNVKDAELVKSIFTVTFIGHQLREYWVSKDLNTQIGRIEKDIATISERLSAKIMKPP